MRTMNCQIARREIEEAPVGEVLGGVVFDHLQSCGSCATFSDEQGKLREIIGSLGTIEAPGDFDFKLRARLAGERPSAATQFRLAGFAFGSRSVALATLLLIFGVGLLFVGQRSVPQTPPSVAVQTQAPVAKVSDERTAVNSVPVLASVEDVLESKPSTVPNRLKSKRLGSSMIAGNRDNRVNSRDFGTSGAPVLKSSDLNARASDFEIRASRQPLKVSLENGQGGSRTISVPAVSFGSQRVLSQNASLMASARGSW